MKFDEGSSVLFIGEGDFSFTEALTRISNFLNVKIVSTCFQEVISERATVNAQKLRERGVEVICGVDATKLHAHATLKNEKFSSVIFNFPHIGGKMKIHLNRKLLEAFFTSACNALVEHGEIVVSLCAGQGGIPLDPVIRKWDDSWQVVLMASRTDLILRRVEQFDSTLYEGYTATGYRSMEKGFGQVGAIAYTFKKSPKDLDNLECHPLDTKDVLLCDGTYVKIPYFLSVQILRNLCLDMTSLVGQICHLIKKHISKLIKLNLGDTILTNENLGVSGVYNHYKCSSPILHNYVNVHPLYILKKVPFSSEIFLLFIYNEKSSSLETMLLNDIELELKNFSKTFTPHHKCLVWYDFMQGPSDVSFKNPSAFQKSEDGLGNLQGFSLNISLLCHKYFEVDSHELWSYGQNITVKNYSLTYSPLSLFPLEYVYDLSFWQCDSSVASQMLLNKDSLAPTEGQREIGINMDLDALATVVINVAQDLLVDFRLLGTYFHPKNKRRSFTYRMRYCSFYRSLSDKKAKDVHAKIGLKLQECLGVEIR